MATHQRQQIDSTKMMNRLVKISLLLTICMNLCEGLAPTLVRISPSQQTKYNQQSAAILCRFKSTLPINVTWYKDNLLLRRDQRIRYEI